MSSSILSVSYAYPIPKCFGNGTTKTISELKSSIESSFKNYTTARDNIFKQLKDIFFSNNEDKKKISLDTDGHIKISDFAEKIKEFSDCDESNKAYKFYCNQIINKINKCSDYINEANSILNGWGTLSGNDSSLIHADVVRLECLEQFCSEIATEFGTRYCYDYEEDNWKLATDSYEASDNYSQIEDDYGTHSDLYNTKVKCNYNGSESKKFLECFNELNLLDRLKYIKEYYDIKIGKTNYVFPENKSTGFPCVAEEGIDETDTRIANLEKFYLGYLIDRDGPVNALCSLFEIKVAALQETIKEMSKKITALNAYLEITNWGMDKLNQSQTNKTEKSGKVVISKDTVLVFTYLCCQKMYNLFEDESKKKFFVIKSLYEQDEPINHYIVPVDRTEGFGVENRVYLNSDREDQKPLYTLEVRHWHGYKETGAGEFKFQGTCTDHDSELHKAGKYYGPRSKWFAEEEHYLGGYREGFKTFKKEFTLPTELDVHAILPESVKYYNKATDADFISGLEENDYTAMIESWTKAFSNKVQYINTAIETINTDIEQLRNKIDTYHSQASTLRNRVHDVYLNTIRKIS